MDVCRLCAGETTEVTSIFSRRHENTLAEMVRFVASIEVLETDRLSSSVCAYCVELTIDAFQYIKRVQAADLLLRGSLQKLDLDKIHSEEEMQSASESSVHHPVCMNTSSPAAVETTEVSEKISQEPVEILLDLDEVSVEYLEDAQESASKKLIGLLIESVHETGSQKWCRIKQDPDYVEMLEKDEIHTEKSEEDDSSDDECFVDVEPKHINYQPKIDGEEPVVRCCSRKCNLVFNTREDLVEHGSEAHVADRSVTDAKSQFECVICFQRFATRRHLLTHLRRLIRDYRCQLCNIYFDAPREKSSHMKKNHQDASKRMPTYRLEDQPTKICCGCESTFETIEELYQHGVDQHQNEHSIMHDSRENQCNICYKFFKSKASLRNHQILVYKPKTYSCPSCFKAFECLSKLSNHETTHRTERNFACSVCRGTFKTATDLKGHQRIHQERNLVCNVCGSRFHKQSQLKSHLKTHDDNAFEFSCTLCPKQFKEKSNWRSHMKVHTKERNYKCGYCTKEFRYTTDRKRHEMTHTGNYPHGCSICGKSFARSTQLKSHVRVCNKREN